MGNSFQLPLVIAMPVTVHIFLDLMQLFMRAQSPLHSREHITASWNTAWAFRWWLGTCPISEGKGQTKPWKWQYFLVAVRCLCPWFVIVPKSNSTSLLSFFFFFLKAIWIFWKKELINFRCSWCFCANWHWRELVTLPNSTIYNY